jgi:hypothetical protein
MSDQAINDPLSPARLHQIAVDSLRGSMRDDRFATWSAGWRDRDWDGIARRTRQSGSYSLGSIFRFLPSAPPHPDFWRLLVRGANPLVLEYWNRNEHQKMDQLGMDLVEAYAHLAGLLFQISRLGRVYLIPQSLTMPEAESPMPQADAALRRQMQPMVEALEWGKLKEQASREGAASVIQLEADPGGRAFLAVFQEVAPRHGLEAFLGYQGDPNMLAVRTRA